MSGVEIAGLVLGAIPILITALEHYAEGVSSIKRYARYKRELASLIRRLGLEEEIMRNTLEELLNGLVPADRILNMLNNPAGPDWKSTELDRKLTKRLRGAHARYLETLEDLIAAVDEFRNRLKIDAMGKACSTEYNSFAYAYQKLKFSLCRKDYEDLMKRIREDNDYLKQLTSQNVKLEPLRASQKMQAIPSFERIREYARSLFSALSSSFSCHCRLSHSVNLCLGSYNDSLIKGMWTYAVLVGSGRHAPPGGSTSSSWKPATLTVLDSIAYNKDCTVGGNDPTYGSPAKKVTRFVTVENAEESIKESTAGSVALAPPGTETISDLCSALQQFWPPEYTHPYYAYLNANSNERKWAIYACHPQDSQTDVVSLHDALAPKSSMHVWRPKVSEKKVLAATLSSSLLQLCETPWMGVDWNSENILLISSQGRPAYAYPHIKIPLDIVQHVRKTRETSSTCIRNEFTFALGVLLVEICLGRPMEELREATDLNPDGTEHMATNFQTATRLLDEVYQEGGGRYGDAVRRCIYCDFDQRKTSLADAAFRRALYEGVVYLLEEDVQEFHNLPL